MKFFILFLMLNFSSIIFSQTDSSEVVIPMFESEYMYELERKNVNLTAAVVWLTVGLVFVTVSFILD